MRTAVICPTCATFVNSDCVIYTGPYLPTLNVNFTENLTTVLYRIELWASSIGPGGIIDYSRVILKIDGMAVNKRSNTNYASIEVGDLIDGEYPLNSGRFIKAKVLALPHTTESNLAIYSDDSI